MTPVAAAILAAVAVVANLTGHPAVAIVAGAAAAALGIGYHVVRRRQTKPTKK